MVTAQEVHSITFDKKLHGYNLDQVDDFLDRVAEQLTADEKQIASLNKENEELKDKLFELAQKLDGYRNDENALKSALLNAQRMGENVIKEARQKADALERESRIRSEDILRAGMEKINEQEMELERIKSEVAQFKATILGLYKMHIESLSRLPGAESTVAAEKPVKDPEPASAPVVSAPVEEPKNEPQVEEPESVAEAEDEMPEEMPEEQNNTENFWQQDDEDLTKEIAEPMSGESETFRGITFSD